MIEKYQAAAKVTNGTPLNDRRCARQSHQEDLSRLQDLRPVPLRRFESHRGTRQSFQQEASVQGNCFPHLHFGE